MKKIISVLTAAFLGMMSVPLCGESVHATSPQLGDWIPQNFSDAMHFQNIYGGTHIDHYPGGQDIACIVFQYSTYINCIFEYEISNENVNIEFHKKYTDTKTDICFDVLAVSDLCKSPDSFEVSYGSGTPYEKVYSFSSDGSGGLTETDDYSWIPDCYTEYRSFEEEHGTLSVVNDCVAFCSMSIPGAGYSWEFTQSGDGKLDKYLSINCNEQYIYQMAGGASLDFVLYKPEADGEVNAEWKYCRSWDPDSVDQIIKKSFEVSGDCSKIHETSTEFPEIITGDVNGDGVLAVNDAVSLQKYLLGMSEAENEKTENADMNGDGIVNIADFCLIKSELVIPVQEELNQAPLPLSGKIKGSSYRISEYNDFGSDLSERGYITESGNEDSFPYNLMICMGEKTTGGYSIYITDIRLDNKNNLTVFVNETSPKSDEDVIQAFTYPCCRLSLDISPDQIKTVSVRSIYGAEYKKLEPLDSAENI